MHDDGNETASIVPRKRGLSIGAGGNYTFYTAGVLMRLLEGGLQYDCASSFSAGGTLLAALPQGPEKIREAVDFFCARIEANEKNFYASKICSEQWPFPQEDIYTSLVRYSVNIAQIQKYDKELRLIYSEVATTRMRSFLALCATLGLAANHLTETMGRGSQLPIWRSLLRIQSNMIDIRSCDTSDMVCRYILGSSAIFPWVRPQPSPSGGGMLIDGKTSTLTPTQVLSDCEHILAIHHIPRPSFRKEVIQLAPFGRVSVGMLNYVDADGVKRLFDQGYTEGQQHFEWLRDTPFI